MDWNTLKDKLSAALGKYKYFLLILLIGLVLMSMPTSYPKRSEPGDSKVQESPESLSDNLESILSQIQGVGKVRVLLTESACAETVYQTDSDTGSDGTIRHDTVIVSGSDRGQSGLVRTVTPPMYLGAIVVCQGGELANVRLSVVQAVSNVTGIPTDRITVLKMK